MNAIVESVKKRLFSNRFIKSVTILASGTAISHLLIILTTPILTRLYSPEDFGILSLYLSIVYLLASVSSLQYEQAIPLPENDEDAFHLFVLAFIITFFTSIIFCLSAITLPLDRWLGISSFHTDLWLLFFSLLGIGCIHVYHAWAIRAGDYPVISKTKVSMNSGQMISQITFGFLNMNHLGLVVGEAIGRISGSYTSYRQFKKRSLPSIRVISMKGLLGALVRYRKFPLLSSWSSLMYHTGAQAPTFFLAFVYGPEASGFYLLAQKILTVPEGLIGYSVSQVYLSQLAEIKRSSAEALMPLFWKTIAKMFVLGAVIYVPIAIIVPHLLSYVFGPGWEAVGTYLQYLSILYFFLMVFKPLSANFYVLEHQQLGAVAEVLRFALICSSLYIAYHYISDPQHSLLLFSVSGAVGYVLYGVFVWVAVKKTDAKKQDVCTESEGRQSAEGR